MKQRYYFHRVGGDMVATWTAELKIAFLKVTVWIMEREEGAFGTRFTYLQAARRLLAHLKANKLVLEWRQNCVVMPTKIIPSFFMVTVVKNAIKPVSTATRQ